MLSILSGLQIYASGGSNSGNNHTSYRIPDHWVEKQQTYRQVSNHGLQALTRTRALCCERHDGAEEISGLRMCWRAVRQAGRHAGRQRIRHTCTQPSLMTPPQSAQPSPALPSGVSQSGTTKPKSQKKCVSGWMVHEKCGVIIM